VLMETPVITEIIDSVAERDSVSQVTGSPPHRKLRARTESGPLLLRIADNAAPKLVASLLKPRSGLDFSVPLRGSGPFNLPMAQSAEAHAGLDAVMLSLRVLAEPGRVATVKIEIPNEQALELGAAIVEMASR